MRSLLIESGRMWRWPEPCSWEWKWKKVEDRVFPPKMALHCSREWKWKTELLSQDDSRASDSAGSCSQVTEKQLNFRTMATISEDFEGGVALLCLLYLHVEILKANVSSSKVDFAGLIPFWRGVVAILQPARYGHIYNSLNSKVLFCWDFTQDRLKHIKPGGEITFQPLASFNRLLCDTTSPQLIPLLLQINRLSIVCFQFHRWKCPTRIFLEYSIKYKFAGNYYQTPGTIRAVHNNIFL